MYDYRIPVISDEECEEGECTEDGAICEKHDPWSGWGEEDNED